MKSSGQFFDRSLRNRVDTCFKSPNEIRKIPLDGFISHVDVSKVRKLGAFWVWKSNYASGKAQNLHSHFQKQFERKTVWLIFFLSFLRSLWHWGVFYRATLGQKCHRHSFFVFALEIEREREKQFKSEILPRKSRLRSEAAKLGHGEDDDGDDDTLGVNQNLYKDTKALKISLEENEHQTLLYA